MAEVGRERAVLGIGVTALDITDFGVTAFGIDDLLGVLGLVAFSKVLWDGDLADETWALAVLEGLGFGLLEEVDLRGLGFGILVGDLEEKVDLLPGVMPFALVGLADFLLGEQILVGKDEEAPEPDDAAGIDVN